MPCGSQRQWPEGVLERPAGPAGHLPLTGPFRLGRPLPGMLLVPKAQGLVEMLQTIYETESCFSADGMSGREPTLEILPRTPLHSIPVAGKWLCVPTCPRLLGILLRGWSTYCESCPMGVLLQPLFESSVERPWIGRAVLLGRSPVPSSSRAALPPCRPLPFPSSASAFGRISSAARGWGFLEDSGLVGTMVRGEEVGQ